MTPRLSVVMPVYNTGSYLRPCLESVLAATLGDLEVVAVDDGSTDGSGARLDEYAARDRRVRVLHVANGGPGRARNLGIEQARGRYLTFVDSDDRVPADAFERLVGTLDRTGSDFATGRIQRFSDTRVWSLEQSRIAMPADADGTHITRAPGLLYDTTDCNKVFRREFWDAAGLRFLEGVVYEDVLPMVRAHLDATAVDVVAATVYQWRRRGGGRSITQTQGRIEIIRDRMASAEAVRELLVERGLAELVRAQDRKALAIDLANALPNLPEAGTEYRRYLAEQLRLVLGRTGEAALLEQPLWRRSAYDLLRHDRLDAAAELMRRRRGTGDDWPVVRRGHRYLAELGVDGVADPIRDVTAELPLRVGVDGIRVDGAHLVLTGWAVLDKVPAMRPWFAPRWLQLRRAGARRWLVRPLRPVRRPELTADSTSADVGYDWGGFTVRLPLARLLRPGADEAAYDLAIGLVDGTGRLRRAPVTGAAAPALEATWTAQTADGLVLSVAARPRRAARLTVSRNPALATAATLGDALDVTVRLPAAAGGDEQLTLRPAGGDPVAVAARADGADRRMVRAAVPLAALPPAASAPRAGEAPQRTWRVTLDRGGRGVPVVAAPALPPASTAAGGREFAVRVGAGGQLLLLDRVPVTLVRALRWESGRLCLDIAGAGAAPVLRHADGTELPPAERQDTDGTTTVRFELLPAPDRSVRPGRWTLLPAAPADVFDPAGAVEIARDVCAAGPAEQRRGAAGARVVPAPRGLTVTVTSGEVAERGPLHQRRLREEVYRRARLRPLRDEVLVLPAGPPGFDGDARALVRELRRRDPAAAVRWVRADTGAPLPAGVPAVLDGSRAYYEALATARTVVTERPLPSWFERRPGTRVVRAGLGTPFGRPTPALLEQWRREAAGWDAAVSGNPHTTEFLRELGYTGRVIEQGAPRTDDVLAAGARRAARARLGLADGQRAVLWAPTWRPQDLDVSGRLVLRLPFELGLWPDLLGPDDVLLLRFHPLVTGATDELHRGPALRNVTTHPDLQELLAAADVLVSDYSSLLGDFAGTGRPIVVYAWDLAEYAREPGLTVELPAAAPGPFVADPEQLAAALRDPAPDAARYAAFRAAFAPRDDGAAAARVVDELG